MKMEKKEEFQILRPLYVDFNENIKNLIKSLIEENSIKFHLIESRTKSLESFNGKITRKEHKYINPIAEITDLAGVRIILYYQDDVEKVEKLLKNEFIIDIENSVDKGELLSPNEFGYQSVHYVVQLSETRNVLSEWKKYATFKAEIQIRTVLQHSWASISHELEYKKTYEIPSILQRKLFRLAGLIELADEEFKKVRDEHNELSEMINQGITSINENPEIFEELNLLTLKKYFEESIAVKRITEDALKAGFKESIRDYILEEDEDMYYSEIIRHCNDLNIKTITEFNKLLIDSLKYSYELFEAHIEEYEKQFKEYITDINSFWHGSPDFFVLLIVTYENISNIKLQNLVDTIWSEIPAERAVRVSRNFKEKSS